MGWWLGLARRYVGLSIRSQLQYRASTVMLLVGQLLVTALEFFGIVMLFERFGSLRGWSLAEVSLLYGIASVSFALAEALGRGFDTFEELVRSGDFDRLLLRPAGTAFQVGVRALQLSRAGRLLQGGAVLAYGAAASAPSWDVEQWALLVGTIIGGMLLFIGLFVVRATLAFWTIASLEIVSALSYGGVETAQFPLVIYHRWLRRFFTYIVPLACLTYFPALALTGHPDPLDTPVWVQWCSPLAGPLFLVAALRFWTLGVRHYRSTGS